MQAPRPPLIADERCSSGLQAGLAASAVPAGPAAAQVGRRMAASPACPISPALSASMVGSAEAEAPGRRMAASPACFISSTLSGSIVGSPVQMPDGGWNRRGQGPGQDIFGLVTRAGPGANILPQALVPRGEHHRRTRSASAPVCNRPKSCCLTLAGGPAAARPRPSLGGPASGAGGATGRGALKGGRPLLHAALGVDLGSKVAALHQGSGEK